MANQHANEREAETESSATAQTAGNMTQLEWREFVMRHYPEILHSTHSVPPLHFNKVPCEMVTVDGIPEPQLLLKYPPRSEACQRKCVTTNCTQSGSQHMQPVRVQGSDVRSDFAQQHVLINLRALGSANQETMFILSQLNYGSYLNEPFYAAAEKNSQFYRPPVPSGLGKKYTVGDFDILIIHRSYGILVGELKSVGRYPASGHEAHLSDDAEVLEVIRKAVGQVDKSERIVNYLVSDITPGLSVRKTLFLPYVTSSRLQRVLASNRQLEQEVCNSLGAPTAAEAIQWICCSDQLSAPDTYWKVTAEILSNLRCWWDRRMACITEPLLTDQLYVSLVARFAGPATCISVYCNVRPRVTVRTEGEAVAEMGRTLAGLVLTEQQVCLMNRSPPLVFLTGPPGTGKTVILVLQGLKWLLEGHDVHIVSLRHTSLAASMMIKNQIQMNLEHNAPSPPPAAVGCVQTHGYHVSKEEDVDTAISELLTAVQGDALHVVLDEIDLSNREETHHLHKLVTALTDRVPRLCLWATSVYHAGIPSELQTEVLTQPLRCTPAILRQVKDVNEMRKGAVHSYSDNGFPAPGDGPSVIELHHQGEGHKSLWPGSCRKCGQNVADLLHHRLGVGKANSDVAVHLNYNDVFILTYEEQSDDLKDEMTSRDCSFVQGLRDEGVPVCVLERYPHDRPGEKGRWECHLVDVAQAGQNQVTFTHYHNVHGLERPVVVWVTSCWKQEVDIGIPERLLCLTRCSTQLVVVYTPLDEGQ